MAAPNDAAGVFLELGAALMGLALLSRAAHRWNISPIPLYLLAGLAFGNGGLAPLHLSEGFIHVGAEIGVLLLLFMLGLEYTPHELSSNLRANLPAGIADLALNFPPGFITGWLLGWHLLPCVVLGGVTYSSSSGLIARLLSDLGRTNNPESQAILSVLVLEDVAMLVYLPLVAASLEGGSAATVATSVGVSLLAAIAILFIAQRYGDHISRLASKGSDEIVLLTTLGAMLLVAGLAESLGISAAIGAFLAGIAFSGPIVARSQRLLGPLRDLFAAIFFFFFGLEINPALLPSVMGVAALLAFGSGATKVLTGWIAARKTAPDTKSRWMAGAVLVARGEFSIVIAGLAAAVEPALGPLAAAYVLLSAVSGPILVRVLSR